ncbi:MAG TPA: hypothetical protein VH589_18655 [Trebonia sp.]
MRWVVVAAAIGRTCSSSPPSPSPPRYRVRHGHTVTGPGTVSAVPVRIVPGSGMGHTVAGPGTVSGVGRAGLGSQRYAATAPSALG